MLWTSLFNIDTQALSVHHYSRHIYIYLETKKGLSILKYLLYNNWLINFVIPSSLRWVRNVHNLIFSGKKVGFFFPPSEVWWSCHLSVCPSDLPLCSVWLTWNLICEVWNHYQSFQSLSSNAPRQWQRSQHLE